MTMSRNMASNFFESQDIIYDRILKSNLMDLDSPTQP